MRYKDYCSSSVRGNFVSQWLKLYHVLVLLLACMGEHSLIAELDYVDWFSIVLALWGVRLPVAKYQMGPPV